MNEKVVKTIKSRSFVMAALLNRGVADSESLRVRRRAYVTGRRDAVFETTSLFLPVGVWLDDPPLGPFHLGVVQFSVSVKLFRY